MKVKRLDFLAESMIRFYHNSAQLCVLRRHRKNKIDFKHEGTRGCANMFQRVFDTRDDIYTHRFHGIKRVTLRVITCVYIDKRVKYTRYIVCVRFRTRYSVILQRAFMFTTRKIL